MVRRWVLDKASLVHALCSTVVGLTRQDLLQDATILAFHSFTIVYAIIQLVFFKVDNIRLQRLNATRQNTPRTLSVLYILYVSFRSFV